jgi:hypothetical protein
MISGRTGGSDADLLRSGQPAVDRSQRRSKFNISEADGDSYGSKSECPLASNRAQCMQGGTER